MFSKLLQLSIFAIMISSSLCGSRIQNCSGGMVSSGQTTNSCGGWRNGFHYKVSCLKSSCSVQNNGEISACTPAPGQHAPALASDHKLKCRDYYTVTADQKLHCRAAQPYPYVVTCSKWTPNLCDNCENTESPWDS